MPKKKWFVKSREAFDVICNLKITRAWNRSHHVTFSPKNFLKIEKNNMPLRYARPPFGSMRRRLVSWRAHVLTKGSAYNPENHMAGPMKKKDTPLRFLVCSKVYI